MNLWSSNGGSCRVEGVIILNIHSHVLEEYLHLACFLSGEVQEDQPEIFHRHPGLWHPALQLSSQPFLVCSDFTFTPDLVCGRWALELCSPHNISWFTGSWKSSFFSPLCSQQTFCCLVSHPGGKTQEAVCCLFLQPCMVQPSPWAT